MLGYLARAHDVTTGSLASPRLTSHLEREDRSQVPRAPVAMAPSPHALQGLLGPSSFIRTLFTSPGVSRHRAE